MQYMTPIAITFISESPNLGLQEIVCERLIVEMEGGRGREGEGGRGREGREREGGRERERERETIM